MARRMILIRKGNRVGFQQLVESVSDYMSEAIPMENVEDSAYGAQDFVADADYEIIIRKIKKK